MNYKAIKKLY